jgi:hypothetical protein
MAADWQLVFDAHEPHDQGDFWAAALGYVVEDNVTLIEGFLAQGIAKESDTVLHNGVRSWRDLAVIGHPDDAVERARGTGSARRVLFQRVPEGKIVKNRVHVDINVGPDRRHAEVERLVGLGARVVAEVAAAGGEFTTMGDPEGNEFDVQ